MENDLLFKFETPTHRDITQLIRNIRQKDRDEVLASHGTVSQAIKCALRQSEYAFTLRARGRLLGICGLVPVSVMGSIGMPWWLSTKSVDRYPITFYRASKIFIDSAHEQYDTLQNFVDTRYTQALNWLRRIGFEVDHNTIEELRGVRFVLVRSQKRV